MTEIYPDVTLKIEKESSSKNSSMDDANRKELLWEHREENVINEWRETMISNSKKHNSKAKRMKNIYRVLMIMSIVFPALLSFLNNFINTIPILVQSMLLTSSIVSGLNGFLNLGARTEKHFQYEASYMKLSNEIRKELCKPKRHRIACDVYLQVIMSDMNTLDRSAPDL